MQQVLGGVARGVNGPYRDDLQLHGVLVEAADEVFGAAVDDVGVARIGDHEAALAAERVIPVALHDGALIIHAGDRDARVVLLGAVHVIGEAIVDRHVIELRRRLIVLRGPGLAAVEGDRGAAVARLDDPVRIARVDPQSVVVAVPRRQEIEGLAAVGRAEQTRVLRIDRVEALRVGEDRGKIPGALSEPAVVVHAPPVLAGVVRAVQAPFGRLDHRVDAPRVGARDRDMDAPEYARGQAVARQVGPARAAVARAVQAAPRTAAREVPWQPSCLPERGVHDARVVRIEADIDRAGLLVLVEDLAPGLAAVRAADHAALAGGAEGMAEGRDASDIGILRVDDQRADLAGVPEADVAPGPAAVDRLVDAIAVRHVAARGRLPGADIDDVRIGGRDGERAHGRDRCSVGQRPPRGAPVRRLPDSPRDRTEIKGIGLAGNARDGERATAAKGA